MRPERPQRELGFALIVAQDALGDGERGCPPGSAAVVDLLVRRGLLAVLVARVELVEVFLEGCSFFFSFFFAFAFAFASRKRGRRRRDAL